MDGRICIVSVVNDDFVPGFIVLLTSILKHNPWFNLKVKVLYGVAHSMLSLENQEELLKIYNNIEFVLVDERRYTNIYKQRDGVLNTPKRLHAAFYILEAFSFYNFDKFAGISSDKNLLRASILFVLLTLIENWKFKLFMTIG